MKPGGPYFYHFRIGHGITLAYIVTPNNLVQFSYAICSKRDQYSKSMGRDISELRLFHSKQSKTGVFKIDTKEPRFSVLKKLCTVFLEDVRVGMSYIRTPSWVRDYVKRNGIEKTVETSFPSKQKKSPLIVAG